MVYDLERGQVVWVGRDRTRPIIRAYLLKEDVRRFWDYRATTWAQAHLTQWLWRAAHCRSEPIKKVVRPLRIHRVGILAWKRLCLSNGALEEDEQQGEGCAGLPLP